MKHFLIKYRLQDGSPEAWRAQIQRFIAAVEADGTLNGRIAYRCMVCACSSARGAAGPATTTAMTSARATNSEFRIMARLPRSENQDCRRCNPPSDSPASRIA